MVTPIKTLKQEQLTFIFNLETNQKKNEERQASFPSSGNEAVPEGGEM